MSKVTTKLASLASEATGSEFTERFELLTKLVGVWEKGDNVSLSKAQSLGMSL